MKFKAVILNEINSPLLVEEIEPTKLQIGQVLVKNLISGLCGAQLQEIAGTKGNSKFVPHLLGHEGCGIVEEVGPGVTNVKPGDKVVLHWRPGTGIEATFPNYIFNGKVISSGKVTTLSEYSIVSENRVTKVDQKEDDVLCALMGCAITTAFGTVNNEANIKLGDKVLVIGVGGVGLFLIKASYLAGAANIYSVDIADKSSLAYEAGSNVFINASNKDFSKLDSNKFDVILDTSCSNYAFSFYSQYLAGGGKYILIGQPKPSSDLTIPNAYQLFNGSGQTIKATQGGMTIPNIDIPRYLNLFRNKNISPYFGVTDYYGLDEINLAVDKLKSGTGGRIVITI